DNLVRFYYRYLYGNEQTLSVLGPINFYRTSIEPTLWTQYIPERFGQICWDYFSLLSHAGKLDGCLDIGRWLSDKGEGNNGVAAALKRVDGVEVYETRYSKSPVGRKDMEGGYAGMDRNMDAKIVRNGFISVNGYEQDCDGMPDLLTGEDLYNI
ncbi:MAG: hypothetical protein LUD50_00895, partial [Clostridia bacterium]|nr:hypothetical protein [Clostridia bacterium]